MPELSIVSVTYQSAAVITSFLESARRAAPEAEIIIVDNASSDGSVEKAARTDSSAVVVRLDRNEGFGRACNIGVSHVRSDWILFVNPDVRLIRVELPPLGWGRRFGLGAAGKLPHIDGTAAAPTVRAETRMMEDWAREVIGPFLPPSISRLLPTRERPPAWATGALLLVRRREFVGVGGFDPRYFLYYEDRDLGARYRTARLPVRRVQGISGVHSPRSSSPSVADYTRSAWALASWFEYVGIWHGQPAATRAARSALLASAVIVGLGSAGDHWARVARKRRQVHGITDFLRMLEHSPPNGDPTYYPHARAALAGASSRDPNR
jgi:N-acetylglucosaminyl-diphospho-decaprenol L-rhamnosyltransferase